MASSKKKNFTQKQKAQLSDKQLKISAILSSVVLALMLIEVFAWLVSADVSISFFAFVLVRPVELIILITAWGLLISGLNKSKKKKIPIQLWFGIAPIILLMFVMPLAKNHAYNRWDCNSYEDTGTDCHEAKEDLKKQSQDMENISYEHTKIRAFVPAYVPPGYTFNNNVWYSVHDSHIYAPFRYDSVRDSATNPGYVFLSMNTVDAIPPEVQDAPKATIGTTKWGGDIVEYKFIDSAEAVNYYVTRINETYIAVKINQKAEPALSNKTIVKILDSAKQIN